jgi:hypothetical protein
MISHPPSPHNLDGVIGFAGENAGRTLTGGDFTGESDVGAIVLQAASKHAPVALRDIDVVEHADGEPIAPVLPGQAAIHADVHAAIVHVVDQSGLLHRH